MLTDYDMLILILSWHILPCANDNCGHFFSGPMQLHGVRVTAPACPSNRISDRAHGGFL